MKIPFTDIHLLRAPKRRGSRIMVRDYDAATISDIYADWTKDGGYVPRKVAHELPRIVARCRQEMKNNPWLTRAVEMLVHNVVGHTGFAFTPQAKNADGRPDEPANKELLLRWKAWAENPRYCDCAGRKTFRGHCRLGVQQWVRDGEHIIRMVPGFRYPENPFAFSLKSYNPTALDPTYCVARTKSGTSIVNGVELDSWAKPIAYYFRTQSGEQRINQSDFSYWGHTHERIPAEQIIHLYDEDIADAVRGYPLVASTLATLHGLNEYEKAELVAAREDANRISTYEAPLGDDGEPADEEDVRDTVMNSAPGSEFVMPRGWKRSHNAPSRPNQNMPDFVKYALRRTAAGCRVGYNKLANDLEGVSYSSMREGTLEERNGYMDMQQIMVEIICRRVYANWLRAYLSFHPACTLPLAKYAKFLSHRWRGRRWPWIDPRSEAKYFETCRKYGWLTDEDIANDLGQEMSENVDSIVRVGSMVQGIYLESNYAADTETT